MDHRQQAEFTNMCMVYDGTRVLVQDRRNPNWPGITFPGGHVHPGESFVDSVVREVKEETGLHIANVRLCGIKQFGSADGEFRYIVVLYKTNTFSGELKSSDEGRVFWVERAELENYSMPHGFQSMLDVFENDQLSENYWFYQNGEMYVTNK